MKFPYTEFLGLEEDRLFRPLISVDFRVNENSYQTYCLIDSGADYVILPIEVAGKLNLKLDTEAYFRVAGAGGELFRVYKSPVKIEQTIKQRGFRDIKCASYVYFAESGGTFMMGQSGFLSHLKVTLNGKKRELEIQ